jgi:hypothetical protein
MRTVIALFLGAVLVVGTQLALRPDDSGWVVAVGGDSFVVLDDDGAPESVCTVDVGETYCYPVRPASDLRRRPVERRPPAPSAAPDLAGERVAV